jgi:hypothetical protein
VPDGRVGLRAGAPLLDAGAGGEHHLVLRGGQGVVAREVLGDVLDVRHRAGLPVDGAVGDAVGAGGVAGQGQEPDRLHGRLAAPVVGVRGVREGLRLEVAEGVRAGADRVLDHVGRRVDVRPQVLGDDRDAGQHVGALHEGGRLEGEGHVGVVRRGRGAGVADVVDRGGAREQVVGEHHVVGGERLAVGPGDVVAQRDLELRAVVVPGVVGAEQRDRVGLGGLVDEEQLLVDRAEPADPGRGERVEVDLVVAGLAGVGDERGAVARGAGAARAAAVAAAARGEQGERRGSGDERDDATSAASVRAC